MREQDFEAFNSGTTRGVDWLVTLTKELRKQLPVGDYILTHARMSYAILVHAIVLIAYVAVAPWFQKGYSGGGYLSVHQQAGDLIDWYNIQFYNRKLP